MSYVTFDSNKKYTYKVEILQVFKPRFAGETERVKHDEPVLLDVAWFTTPASARNYGSYRTGRSEWYHNIGKPGWEYVKVDKDGNKVAPHEWPIGYKWEKRDIPKPYEPNLDYRVYRVPVSMDMSEAVLLPALKKLYEVAE